MKLSKVYKARTFKEAKKLCPKGYRMLEIWELMKLACEKHPIIFDTDKDKGIFFWSSSLIRQDIILSLYRDVDGFWLAFWDCLSNSGDFDRVFFIKDVKE